MFTRDTTQPVEEGGLEAASLGTASLCSAWVSLHGQAPLAKLPEPERGAGLT